ncbi:AraC family transcriptional regulator [Zobellia sp.]|nr:AraC family transcriptional regulator [Zobellia sp.]
MQTLEAYKPFEIQEIELTEWKRRPVKHNFFELVLIRKGEGLQCINYNEYAYHQHNMFLLPPLKCHSFTINEPTTFVFLKFTDSFFKSTDQTTIGREEWFSEASYILSNFNQLPGDIIENEIDKNYLKSIVNMILQESRNYGYESINLITSLMTSILEILIRNIKKSSYFEIPKKNADDRIAKMLTYINRNIHQMDMLKVEKLADVFDLSPTYVSEFFKKQIKIPLREYIIKAKLKLVEIRLINSDCTLTQIAFEQGFTDVSHLSKTFKRFTGMSIREFKKNGQYILLKRSNGSKLMDVAKEQC